MKIDLFAPLAVLVALAATPGLAGTYTLITPYSGAGTATAVLGINDLGQMTGSITKPDGSVDGFARSASGAYVLFSDGYDTYGRNINNAGQITGYATGANGDLLTDTEFQLQPNHTFTTLIDSATGQPIHGIAQGQNSAGDVVGDSFTRVAGQTYVEGYLLHAGAYTGFQYGPPPIRTRLRGLSDRAVGVGFYTDASGVAHGLVIAGATVSTFDDPNATPGSSTFLEDVNSLYPGFDVVGEWVDPSGNNHAFMFDNRGLTELTPPSGTGYQAFGVNNLGQVVLTNGTLNWIYSPGNVPEPGVWALMLVGIGGCGAALRTRRGLSA